MLIDYENVLVICSLIESLGGTCQVYPPESRLAATTVLNGKVAAFQKQGVGYLLLADEKHAAYVTRLADAILRIEDDNEKEE